MAFLPIYEILHVVRATLQVFHLHIFSNHGLPSQGPPNHPQTMSPPNHLVELPNLLELDVWSSSPSRNPNYSLFTPLLRQIRAPNAQDIGTIHVASLRHIAECNPFPGLQIAEIINHSAAEAFGDPMVENESRNAPLSLARATVGHLFKTLDQLLQLRSVRFSFIKWVDSEYMRGLVESCPQLFELILEGCDGVKEEDLRRLVEIRKDSTHLMAIQSLQLYACTPIQLGSEAHVWFQERIADFCYLASLIAV